MGRVHRLERLERRVKTDKLAPSWPLWVDPEDPGAVGSVVEGEELLQKRGRGITPPFKNEAAAREWAETRGMRQVTLILVIYPQEDPHA